MRPPSQTFEWFGLDYIYTSSSLTGIKVRGNSIGSTDLGITNRKPVHGGKTG